MRKNTLIILGIESSCDETSVSVCVNGKITSNCTAIQPIHEKFGGVVPELASRAHDSALLPTLKKALALAKIEVSEINAVACTQGPGLLGALLVGYTFAKGLAFSLNIPLINVHHMKAHILAHFIEEPYPTFPFLCLTVSGGHTQIVLVKSPTEMQILGQTLDDAVGEAFDKGAKLLGLGYPGGPAIDSHAKKGDQYKFQFSQSDMPDYDFSFSGIKTSLLYFLQKNLKVNPNFINENLNDLCASYQHKLVEILVSKLTKASIDFNIKNIAIAGGVAANSALRDKLTQQGINYNWAVFIPKFEYCTDNAAMIAKTGDLLYRNKQFASLYDSPNPRLPF